MKTEYLYQDEIPVSRVITPISDFIVISYRDKPEQKIMAGIFDGDYPFALSNDDNYLENILKFCLENSHLEIDAEEIKDYCLKMPKDLLGNILSDSYIEKEALRYFNEHCIDPKNNKPIPGSPPTEKELLGHVKQTLANYAFWQLIRNTSEYNLTLINNDMPSSLVWDSQDRGFMVVGSGHGSNCGYGSADVHFYEIVEKGEQEQKPECYFISETLQVRQVFKATSFYLQGSRLEPEKISKLRNEGTIVEFEGYPLFIDIKCSKLERLVDAFPK